ncbi:hypothetical protein [Sphingomonas sp.]|uniref:hypothetical protein n=1 Tax=Sphingomonas sp. TaxID=28214 RepID=UPI003CC62B22
MIPGGDPVRLLLRALRHSAAAGGVAPTLTHEEQTPWASATFTGAQHRVAVEGGGIDGWLAALPEIELDLRGHLVASCDVLPTRNGAVLTVLVLEA